MRNKKKKENYSFNFKKIFENLKKKKLCHIYIQRSADTALAYFGDAVSQTYQNLTNGKLFFYIFNTLRLYPSKVTVCLSVTKDLTNR